MLPFDSLAVVARHEGNASSAVIAEALGHDLAAMLARAHGLRVPRAEFVRPYALSALSAEEIGRALNVRAVALCTVRACHAHVDAAIDLIDVVRETLIARESFLVSGRELLALQRVMIRAIAPHCCVPRATQWHPVTTNEAVYARIVQARAAAAARDPEGALAMLEEARRIHPRSAAVALETAAAIVEGRVFPRFAEAGELLRGLRGCVPALQLRAKLAAHFDGDWPAAERALRDALEIDPISPSTLGMLGDVLLAMRRREEAAPFHRLAAELMPLDERAQIAASFEAYFGPQPLDAVPRLAALTPELASANDWLVRALLAAGDVLGARRAAATPFGRALVGAFTHDTFYAAPFSAHGRALLFSAAGAFDAATACLEASNEEALFFAAVEPLFSPLTREGRFASLLSRLGL